MATKLEMIGIQTIEDLAQVDPAKLQRVRGLGPVRIQGIILAAQACIARETGKPVPLFDVEEPATKPKKKKAKADDTPKKKPKAGKKRKKKKKKA